MARTARCDQCGAERPDDAGEGLVTAWAGWLALVSPALEHGTQDFCSLACLSAWVAART